MKLKEIKKENISYKTNIYSKCLEEDTWNKLSRWNVNIGILKTHVQPIGMLQKKKKKRLSHVLSPQLCLLFILMTVVPECISDLILLGHPK